MVDAMRSLFEEGVSSQLSKHWNGKRYTNSVVQFAWCAFKLGVLYGKALNGE